MYIVIGTGDLVEDLADDESFTAAHALDIALHHGVVTHQLRNNHTLCLARPVDTAIGLVFPGFLIRRFALWALIAR